MDHPHICDLRKAATSADTDSALRERLVTMLDAYERRGVWLRQERTKRAHCDVLRDLARWLLSMDDPEDVQGPEARRTVTLKEIIRRARAALGDAGDPPAPDAATWSALLREMARRVATQRGATRLAMMALGDASDVRDDLMRSWTSDEPAAAAVRRVWPAGARVLDGMADAWLEDHWPDDIPDVPAPVGGAGDPAPADPAVREAIASALLDGAPPEAFDDLTRRVLACVASGALTGDDGAAIVTALAARTATPPPAEPDGRIVALRAMCTEAETTAVAAAAVDGLHRLPAWLTTPEIRSVIDEETTDGSR